MYLEWIHRHSADGNCGLNHSRQEKEEEEDKLEEKESQEDKYEE